MNDPARVWHQWQQHQDRCVMLRQAVPAACAGQLCCSLMHQSVAAMHGRILSSTASMCPQAHMLCAECTRAHLHAVVTAHQQAVRLRLGAGVQQLVSTHPCAARSSSSCSCTRSSSTLAVGCNLLLCQLLSQQLGAADGGICRCAGGWGGRTGVSSCALGAAGAAAALAGRGLSCCCCGGGGICSGTAARGLHQVRLV
jgi:hypothetical protein